MGAGGWRAGWVPATLLLGAVLLLLDAGQVQGHGHREDDGREEEEHLVLRPEPGAQEGLGPDRKSTRLNSSHSGQSRMPSSA